MLKYLFLSLLTSLTIVSCRSVPMASLEQDREAKTFQTSPDMAKIYIYRNEFLGNQIKVDVTLNGKMVGRTMGKTYLVLKVPAGQHSIMSEAENKSTLDIKVEKGKNYFVWQESKFGFWLARTQLHSVPDSEGREGVNECKMIQQVSE
ncbi:MAG: DUF2846 domain-containing protein [Bdellovibrionaceae bacterium]|nr:DUF2846 domain-containing protein [Pseudobdellovibrionaceae bacterium]